jgi:hypothetical protein
VFLVWALVRGHYRALLAAAALSAGALVVVAAWANTSPLDIVETWLGVVRRMFGAASPQRGVTEWWGLIEAWVPASAAGGLRATGAVAGGAVLWLALRAIRGRDPAGHAALACIALWSLATLFHRRYDLILLAPAFVCLWVAARKERRASRRTWMWILIVSLHVALVIDIPWAWQLYYGPQARPTGPLSWLAVHFDRLLILAVAAALWDQFRNREPGVQRAPGT